MCDVCVVGVWSAECSVCVVYIVLLSLISSNYVNTLFPSNDHLFPKRDHLCAGEFCGALDLLHLHFCCSTGALPSRKVMVFDVTSSLPPSHQPRPSVLKSMQLLCNNPILSFVRAPAIRTAPTHVPRTRGYCRTERRPKPLLL